MNKDKRADASKAQRELGWETDIPKLEDIVSNVWNLHNNHPNGYEDQKPWPNIS